MHSVPFIPFKPGNDDADVGWWMKEEGRKGEGSNNTCFDHGGEEASEQAAASQSPSMLTRIYMERKFGS